MKNETKIWIDYAGENLESARILLNSDLYNSCLHPTSTVIGTFLLHWHYNLLKLFIATRGEGQNT